jgi:hypothetical protein
VPSKNMNLFLHNRKERDIIFVDWKVQEYCYNMYNGIFIPPYEGPPSDKNTEADQYLLYLY